MKIESSPGSFSYRSTCIKIASFLAIINSNNDDVEILDEFLVIPLKWILRAVKIRLVYSLDTINI